MRTLRLCSLVFKKINAIHYKHKEAARLLIRNGADVNVRNVEWNTLLDLAVLKGRQEIIELLKKYKRGNK